MNTYTSEDPNGTQQNEEGKEDVSGRSVILEETIDEGYEPSEEGAHTPH